MFGQNQSILLGFFHLLLLLFGCSFTRFPFPSLFSSQLTVKLWFIKHEKQYHAQFSSPKAESSSPVGFMVPLRMMLHGRVCPPRATGSPVACFWVPTSSSRPAELLRLTSWLSHQRPHVRGKQPRFALIYKCHLLQTAREAWERQSWTDLFWHQHSNVARYTYVCHIQI